MSEAEILYVDEAVKIGQEVDAQREAIDNALVSSESGNMSDAALLAAIQESGIRIRGARSRASELEVPSQDLAEFHNAFEQSMQHFDHWAELLLAGLRQRDIATINSAKQQFDEAADAHERALAALEAFYTLHRQELEQAGTAEPETQSPASSPAAPTPTALTDAPASEPIPSTEPVAEQDIDFSRGHIPQPGTSERKAIMDAARKKLGTRSTFVVNAIVVSGSWAVADISPSRGGTRRVVAFHRNSEGQWKASKVYSYTANRFYDLTGITVDTEVTGEF